MGRAGECCYCLLRASFPLISEVGWEVKEDVLGEVGLAEGSSVALR